MCACSRQFLLTVLLCMLYASSRSAHCTSVTYPVVSPFETVTPLTTGTLFCSCAVSVDTSRVDCLQDHNVTHVHAMSSCSCLSHAVISRLYPLPLVHDTCDTSHEPYVFLSRLCHAPITVQAACCRQRCFDVVYCVDQPWPECSHYALLSCHWSTACPWGPACYVALNMTSSTVERYGSLPIDHFAVTAGRRFTCCSIRHLLPWLRDVARTTDCFQLTHFVAEQFSCTFCPLVLAPAVSAVLPVWQRRELDTSVTQTCSSVTLGCSELYATGCIDSVVVNASHDVVNCVMGQHHRDYSAASLRLSELAHEVIIPALDLWSPGADLRNAFASFAGPAVSGLRGFGRLILASCAVLLGFWFGLWSGLVSGIFSARQKFSSFASIVSDCLQDNAVCQLGWASHLAQLTGLAIACLLLLSFIFLLFLFCSAAFRWWSSSHTSFFSTPVEHGATLQPVRDTLS